jgi:hypothetical protein
MTASDALRAFLAPILPAWRIQLGRWVDDSRSGRYAVIKPAGGALAGLVRRPSLTLSLIGADGDPITATHAAADSVIEAMRSSSGAIVSMQPAEPVFVPTSDGRAVFEIAISAITV